MDIYSKEDTKVRYTGKGGYDSDKAFADRFLIVGNVYTVQFTDVGGFHTDVYLKQFPNEAFNSVMFENCETPEELEKVYYLAKPPIGIVPRSINDQKRLLRVKEAIERYTAEFLHIPIEWVEEYNELITKVNKKRL